MICQAGLSALSFLQYFDTAGWMTGRHPAHKNVPSTPKILFMDKCRKTTGAVCMTRS